MWKLAVSGVVSLFLVGAVTSSAGGAEYDSYDKAIAAAAPLMRSRDYSAAREPLEAALKLARTDREKSQAYQGLRAVYRTIPESDKMIEVYEYLVAAADTTAGRSVTASDYAGFLFQRGLYDSAIERYEERLKKDENDVAALSLLPEIYKRHKPNQKPRGEELAKRLQTLNVSLATKKAERLEKEAVKDPKTAATTYKEAAQAWIEAGEKDKARGAAVHSAQSLPEARSQILTLQWREALGDIFMVVDDPAAAVREFEKAVEVAPAGILQKNVSGKLEKARAALANN